MRLEIEDNKGFKWALRVGIDRGKRAMLLMHCHDGWSSSVTAMQYESREYLCLYFPNQSYWSCGACGHKVPPEVVEYYETVKWGLDTMMFDDEDGVL